jgi:Rrf2 family transcriptional regulator, iron-sulfur cluster assembly transcription factor
MIYLAAHDETAPVTLGEIAGVEGMPQAFLERILARLREGGLVGTRRGASGGYSLARPAGTISVGDVVTAIEGPLSLVGCLPDEKGCSRAGDCSSKGVWRRLDDAIAEALNGISLDELVPQAVQR